ncbi:radial spoke head 10 protein [Planoprotostelium fungivorum]|uniref:Radial spoke head 10 protein n=1 Tax=Planoprotostelium fungivorum TaxID=1890364 RepID=A0A2P6NZ15_9EUKA|nr:radial spoke head 10 protein [Planoprotostelium fungivorum]
MKLGFHLYDCQQQTMNIMSRFSRCGLTASLSGGDAQRKFAGKFVCTLSTDPWYDSLLSIPNASSLNSVNKGMKGAFGWKIHPPVALTRAGSPANEKSARSNRCFSKMPEDGLFELEVAASTLGDVIDTTLIQLMRCDDVERTSLQMKLNDAEDRLKMIREQIQARKRMDRMSIPMDKMSIPLFRTKMESPRPSSPRRIHEENNQQTAAIDIQRVYRGYAVRATLSKDVDVKMQKKRNAAWRELISSEEVYVQLLRLLQHIKGNLGSIDPSNGNFRMASSNNLPLHSKNRLTAADLDMMFGNSDEILKFHEHLLGELKRAHWSHPSEHLIDSIFRRNFESNAVGLYVQYVFNYPLSNKIYSAHQDSESFNRIVHESLVSMAPEIPRHLPSCLITPVQRVPRYVLLFNEIKRYTPEDDIRYRLIHDLFTFMKDTSQRIDDEIEMSKKSSKSKKSKKIYRGGSLKGGDIASTATAEIRPVTSPVPRKESLRKPRMVHSSSEIDVHSSKEEKEEEKREMKRTGSKARDMFKNRTDKSGLKKVLPDWMKRLVNGAS